MLMKVLAGTLKSEEDKYGVVTSDLACSATAFLVWDVLINLDKEIEYIWWGPNSWAKWTYLFIRHVPYLAQGSILTLIATPSHIWNNGQCRAWIAYQLAVNELLTIAVELVLIVRIYAMFNRNRMVVAVVWVLFVAEIAAMCTILAIAVPRIRFTPQCLIISTPTLFTSYWTISLAFETTLFVLTLVKFCSLFGQIRKQSIMLVLMKDGTWAFAIIFVMMLLNTVMYNVEKNTLAGVCYFWELSIMSFAGSHVLLNLRQLSMDPRGTFSLVTSTTRTASPRPYVSGLHFAVVEETLLDTTIELQTLSN